MIATLSKYKGWIIGIVVIVLLFLAYSQFIAKKSATSDSALVPVQAATNGANQNGGAGREFVIQLLAIQSIHFNTELFGDPAYTYLHDFSRPIIDQPKGRPNPFAPIGDDSNTVVGDNAAPVATPALAATTTGFIKISDGTSTAATSTKTKVKK